MEVLGHEEQLWKDRMHSHLQEQKDLFPAGDLSRETCTSIIEQEILRQHAITRILEMHHPERDLGNLHDPLDELIYIMLSRRTDEAAYQGSFERLRSSFPNWQDVLAAPLEEVEALVGSSGLGTYKARDIQGALQRIRDEFDAVTLDPLRAWPDDRIEAFLTSLPGVGPKSAYCVMMYALGRAAFPVDAHAGRVLRRVGLWIGAGLDLADLPGDHKQLQRILADLLVPATRHSLHVSLVIHGREICRPRPRCLSCPVQHLCVAFQQGKVHPAE